MASNSEVAERLFASLSSGDIETARALCAEHMEGRQNGGPPFGFKAMARLSVAVRRVAPDWRYENAVRVDTTDGFVEEHDACGTLRDGTSVRIPACIVATMSDGLVVTMHEYLDSAAAAPLTAAFTAPE